MASDKGEDGDELGLDLPEEYELWEQLKAPELWMAAALALREIWRHSEGPFAVVVNTLMIGFTNVINVTTVFAFNTFIFVSPQTVPSPSLKSFRPAPKPFPPSLIPIPMLGWTKFGTPHMDF